MVLTTFNLHYVVSKVAFTRETPFHDVACPFPRGEDRDKTN